MTLEQKAELETLRYLECLRETAWRFSCDDKTVQDTFDSVAKKAMERRCITAKRLVWVLKELGDIT